MPGLRNIGVGILLLIVGAGVTIGTYAMAQGGGVYFVAYGAVIAGVVQIIRGAIQYIRFASSAPLTSATKRIFLGGLAAIVLAAAIGGGLYWYWNSTSYLAGVLVASTDVDARGAALRKLADRNDPVAIAAMVSALGDSDPYLREDVADALGDLHASAAVDALMVGLPKQGTESRTNFARALGQIGEPRARPTLIEASGHSANSYEDGYFVGALENLKPAYSADLLPMLASSNAHQRSVGAQVMAGLTYGHDAAALGAFPGVVPQLAPLLHDPDEETSNSAAQALANSGDAQAKAATLAAISDPDPRAREAAGKAIASVAGGLAMLTTALSDADDAGKIGVGYGLAQIAISDSDDAKGAVDALNEAMAQNDLAVGRGAYTYFIHAGRSDAVDYLTAVLTRYGDKEMALKFLNCEEEQLDSAAKSWATAHNYEVTNEEQSSDSADKLTWGGN